MAYVDCGVQITIVNQTTLTHGNTLMAILIRGLMRGPLFELYIKREGLFSCYFCFTIQ